MPAPIQFDPTGESAEYTATRPVRNSDHDLGTIEQGAGVFFRQDRDGSVTLAYAADGSPTNGNQYARFADVATAVEFAARVGLELA